MIAPQVRIKRWLWIKLNELLLLLDAMGWKRPRQVIHTPLIVLMLSEPKGQEALMFRLKVKLWLVAIRFSFWLKRSIEVRAAKSVGLIGGGAMLVNRKSELLNEYLKTIEESKFFEPN